MTRLYEGSITTWFLHLSTSFIMVDDAMDRMIKQIDPLGNVFMVKYDEHGNKIKEVNPNYYNEEEDDGIGMVYKYDSSHRQINTIFPDGSKSRIKYDPQGI